MQEQLSAALTAGYSLLAISPVPPPGASFVVGGGGIAAILYNDTAKTEHREHRMLSATNSKEMAEKLNAEGRIGFCLGSGDLFSRRKLDIGYLVSSEVVAVVEEVPGESKLCDYRVVTANGRLHPNLRLWKRTENMAYEDSEINAGLVEPRSKGYFVVAIGMGFDHADFYLERESRASPELGSPLQPDRQFVAIYTGNTDRMQSELERTARLGFRVVAVAHDVVSRGEDFVLLERVAAAQAFSYVSLRRSLPDLQKRLNEEGARGFRLLYHSLSLRALLMESAQGAPQRYQYRLIRAGSQPAFYVQTSHSLEEGYSAVGFTMVRGKLTLLLATQSVAH